MKATIIIQALITTLFIMGCKNTKEDPKKEIEEQVSEETVTNKEIGFSISECIHHALYYLKDTDIKTYDSLDTRYFHEIMGYTHKEAIDLENKIITIKQNISMDTLLSIPSIVRDEMQLEIDSLRNELNFYDKDVIGYVFVHTYMSNSDTLSAIIVMNKNCSSSHAIPVKTISNIDPDDYVYRVNQINEKEI